MKKDTYHTVLSLRILFAFIGPVQGAAALKWWIDGNYVVSYAEPFIENGRTLVPLRVITGNLAHKVFWDGEESSVIIQGIKEAELGVGYFFQIGKPYHSKITLL